MIHITKIYLVTNCYNDPNKVYIGKTKNSRKSSHKKTYGDKIEYTYIDEVNSLNRKDWEPLESYWIEQFRQWGFEVMNPNKKGGGGPEFVTDETKEKISLKHKGTNKPWVSENFKGKTLSNSQIEKIKQHLIGTKRTQQTKDKMSLDRKGKPKPEEFGSKISKSLTGYKRTEENKNNISKALKGKIKTDETRKKMSLNSKNKNNKSILQYDKNMIFIKEFKSLTEACLYINKPGRMGDLTSCCKGKSKTAYGFIWKYKNN
jgi:hypothetical protein